MTTGDANLESARQRIFALQDGHARPGARLLLADAALASHSRWPGRSATSCETVELATKMANTPLSSLRPRPGGVRRRRISGILRLTTFQCRSSPRILWAGRLVVFQRRHRLDLGETRASRRRQIRYGVPFAKADPAVVPQLAQIGLWTISGDFVDSAPVARTWCLPI